MSQHEVRSGAGPSGEQAGSGAGGGTGAQGKQAGGGTGKQAGGKKKGSGSGGKKVGGRPNPGHQVPALGGPASQAVPIGVPLRLALTGPIANLKQATREAGTVSRGMRLTPEIQDAPPPTPYQARIYAGMRSLSYLVGRALQDCKDEGIPLNTEVTPEALPLADHRGQLFEQGTRTAAQGQTLAADGRLFLGAKFTFLYGKVMDVYRRRLQKGTPQEQLDAVRAFSGLDRIRFRMLSQMQTAQKATRGEKAQLADTLSQQQDAAAFDRTVDILDKGLRPDPATLQAALRHADRLDAEHGLGLAPEAAVETAGPNQRKNLR